MRPISVVLFALLISASRAHALDTMRPPGAWALESTLRLATAGPQCVAVPKAIPGMGDSFRAPAEMDEPMSSKHENVTVNMYILLETWTMIQMGDDSEEIHFDAHE